MFYSPFEYTDNTGELTSLYFFHFQILRPESGWYAIPLKSLLESSQVKKAYQKARLCLHPDKLQQRGATLLQKYVAEKAFSILQVWKIYKPYIINSISTSTIKFFCGNKECYENQCWFQIHIETGCMGCIHFHRCFLLASGWL